MQEIEKIPLNGGDYKKGELAVLLIDMQTDFIANLDLREINRIVRNQIEIIRRCRRDSIPLFIIEYNNHGETIGELKKELFGIDIRYIKKNNDDAFIDTQLHNLLSEKKIKTLFLMGVNAGACVLYTAEGALDKGYQVMTSFAVMSDIDDNYFFSSIFWFEENTAFFEVLPF